MKIVSDIKQVVVPRRLRVGVVSDSQLTPFRHNEPTTFESNLLAACRTLKEQECAFVVFAGDICNRASVFGDDKPVVQAIMGNHDYYAHLSPRRLFERELGMSPFSHYVVNGWHFIGASPDGCGMYDGYKKVRGWIAEQLRIAEADSDRPVFVTTHNAPRGTVYGSARWGDDSLAGLFDAHPQVVNFSGHTHYSLLDPRAFWQGSFTAFGTQSLSYIEMEKGRANGSVPPLAHTAPMGYILDFSDDGIAVLRYNMLTGREQLADERVILPAHRPPAEHPAKRERSAPVFREGEGEWRLTEEGTELSFPRAEGAHHYKLAFSDGVVQTYFSDFYLGDEAKGERQTLVLYGLKEGVRDIAVTAVSAFGERSAACVRVEGVRVLARKYRRKLAPEIWY